MKKFAIIVAGGKGIRMGNDIPKQFLLLHGKPILMHSIEQFYKYDNAISIIVVLPMFQFDFWANLCKTHNFSINHQIIAGGDQRFNSVRNGLDFISEINSVTAIHDGVRPLVTIETINRCFNTALKEGNAVPSINVVDSIRMIKTNGNEVANRDNVRLIQTPQTFQTKILKEAYNQPWNSNFTDDATVIESIGYKINLVEGNIENIKITSPTDLKIAEVLLNKEQMV